MEENISPDNIFENICQNKSYTKKDFIFLDFGQKMHKPENFT